jgi:hypothetical protein
MALVVVLMLLLGARLLNQSTAEQSLARPPLQGRVYTPAEQTETAFAASQQAPTPSYPEQTQTAAANQEPTSDPFFPTDPPAEPEPTTDPGLLPTITPEEEFFPTDPPAGPIEQPPDNSFPTETPTVPVPTPIPTAQGLAITCVPGTVVELNGGDGFLIPDTRLLVYLESPLPTLPTPTQFPSADEGQFEASGSSGVTGGTGGELPTSALPGSSFPSGGGGQVVGSGQVRYDGFFRLALALDRLRPGVYPLQVRVRDSQEVLARFVCNIDGAQPTALALTPGRTPAPEPGSQLACIIGDQLQITGRGTPRSALLVSFDRREVAGGTVLDDGTYNIPLVFAEQRAGAYSVTVSERASRRQLTTFTCLVPTRPTITPINDRPS